MNFSILTIFPELFVSFWDHGIIKRAAQQGKIHPETLNIRDFAEGRHRVTDDRPYGGGCGMVMKPEPLAKAIRAAKCASPASRTILLTPQGKVFNQQMARDLATVEGLVLICGRYEGVDERICSNEVDEEISIGDYVMTGGELAAMVIVDAVTRLIPGVLGNEDSAGSDSFSNGLLEHAQYTRPPEFEDHSVPEVLMSGNHEEIERWRLESSVIRTFLKRPDLLSRKSLSAKETEILKKWCYRIEELLRAQPLRGSDSQSGKG